MLQIGKIFSCVPYKSYIFKIYSFLNARRVLAQYIVAYHKKMYFELSVFDWVETHICCSMHYVYSVVPNSCSIIKLNYLCNEYEDCKYEQEFSALCSLL